MALVVVADDNEDVRNVMLRALRRSGHTVVEAADGAAALHAVREQKPDAVITDIDMPELTGLQLCQAIRADPHLGDLPVVFVSGNIRHHDDHASTACATAVLAKPFLPTELLACLDRALAGRPVTPPPTS